MGSNMSVQFNIEAIGCDALLIKFTGASNQRVMPIIAALQQALINQQAKTGIIDIVPSYQTILLHFHLSKTSYTELAPYLSTIIKPILSTGLEIEKTSETLITIPACYHQSLAIDIHAVAQQHQLSHQDVVELHSAKIYTCYTIGFMPGFGYLGDLDTKLHTPRLKTPRSTVSAGSIAIADNQTAIYPQDSPGGWHIIGKTPSSMLACSEDGLMQSRLYVGCQVQFQPISLDEYQQRLTAIENDL